MVDREMKIGAAINNDHVLSYDGWHDDSISHSICPWVDGSSLEAICPHDRASDAILRVCLPLIVDMLVGLSAIHCLQSDGGRLVHQAPVPRHLLVGTDGIGRLCDLGSCVGGGNDWSPRSSDRLRPDEMAPEQALAPAHVDERADIFIAATTLRRVLTGHSLFGGDTPEQSMQKMLRMPIPSLSDDGVRASPKLERLMHHAVARARADRLRSAAEFADSLRSYAQQAGQWASRDEIGNYVRSLKQQGASAAHATVPRSAAPARGDSHATIVGYAPLSEELRSQLAYVMRPTSLPPRADRVTNSKLEPVPFPERSPPAHFSQSERSSRHGTLHGLAPVVIESPVVRNRAKLTAEARSTRPDLGAETAPRRTADSLASGGAPFVSELPVEPTLPKGSALASGLVTDEGRPTWAIENDGEGSSSCDRAREQTEERVPELSVHAHQRDSRGARHEDDDQRSIDAKRSRPRSWALRAGILFGLALALGFSAFRSFLTDWFPQRLPMPAMASTTEARPMAAPISPTVSRVPSPPQFAYSPDPPSKSVTPVLERAAALFEQAPDASRADVPATELSSQRASVKAEAPRSKKVKPRAPSATGTPENPY